ncbi:hypothetical protein PR202_ga30560 [Eleusine coracana subsp. coracana]|uniref:PGG domain-containing protein n=1 Tax=Eleusine coracana subsp. coracana TaxID=191504 RepID=A0AAV5DPQ9_ELECO|nr:hypothetical protein PR202_ga30560 [Eleusine coracana subsp. coracana]
MQVFVWTPAPAGKTTGDAVKASIQARAVKLKEANLHLLLLHLRCGGAASVGLLAVVVAVSSAFSCFFFPVPASAGSGGPSGAAALLVFALAVTGVNLITAGVLRQSSTAVPLDTTTRSVFRKMASSVRRNIAVVAVSAASFAVTSAVGSSARPALCFGFFALFLVTVTLLAIGVTTT